MDMLRSEPESQFYNNLLERINLAAEYQFDREFMQTMMAQTNAYKDFASPYISNMGCMIYSAASATFLIVAIAPLIITCIAYNDGNTDFADSGIPSPVISPISAVIFIAAMISFCNCSRSGREIHRNLAASKATAYTNLQSGLQQILVELLKYNFFGSVEEAATALKNFIAAENLSSNQIECLVKGESIEATVIIIAGKIILGSNVNKALLTYHQSFDAPIIIGASADELITKVCQTHRLPNWQAQMGVDSRSEATAAGAGSAGAFASAAVFSNSQPHQNDTNKSGDIELGTMTKQTSATNEESAYTPLLH